MQTILAGAVALAILIAAHAASPPVAQAQMMGAPGTGAVGGATGQGPSGFQPRGRSPGAAVGTSPRSAATTRAARRPVVRARSTGPRGRAYQDGGTLGGVGGASPTAGTTGGGAAGTGPGATGGAGSGNQPDTSGASLVIRAGQASPGTSPQRCGDPARREENQAAGPQVPTPAVAFGRS